MARADGAPAALLALGRRVQRAGPGQRGAGGPRRARGAAEASGRPGGHSGRAHNYSTETTLGDLRRLDLKNPSKWEDLPGGPKLQGLALVAYRGRLVRVGGMQPQNAKSEKTDTKSQATCAMFDPKASKWTEIEPLPEARSSHDAAVAGDTLYVFGGWQLNGKDGKSEWLDHGWSLDLAKWGSKWKKVDQPFQRRALTMSAVGGKVYVIGGLNAKGETELTVNVFDTKSGKWSEGPPLPGENRPRSRIRARSAPNPLSAASGRARTASGVRSTACGKKASMCEPIGTPSAAEPPGRQATL